MKIIGISSNGGSNSNRSIGGKTSFWGQHGSSHGGHHQHEGQPHGGGWKNVRGRGSRGGHGRNHWSQQPNSNSNYYYCEKPKHMAKNYYKKEHDA